MHRLRPTVYEMVAGPGQEPMSLDSHFKTFNTTPCDYLSHSNSSFTCKTPLSPSSHSFLFCPSLLSMLACPSCFLTYPCDMFSGLWRLGFSMSPPQARIPLHFCPFCPFLRQTSFIPTLPGSLPCIPSSVFECFLALHLFGLLVCTCCLVA